MAKIDPIVKQLKAPVATTRNMFKKGLGSGALIGTTTGVLDALGIHPFVSNMIGGAVVAQFFVKDPLQQQIAIMESAREGVRKLIS